MGACSQLYSQWISLNAPRECYDSRESSAAHKLARSSVQSGLPRPLTYITGLGASFSIWRRTVIHQHIITIPWGNPEKAMIPDASLTACTCGSLLVFRKSGHAVIHAVRSTSNSHSRSLDFNGTWMGHPKKNNCRVSFSVSQKNLFPNIISTILRKSVVLNWFGLGTHVFPWSSLFYTHTHTHAHIYIYNYIYYMYKYIIYN